MKRWKVYEIRRGIDDLVFLRHMVQADSSREAVLIVASGCDEESLELIVMDQYGLDVVERHILR